MSKELIVRDFVFDGAMIPPAIASVTHGPWAGKITKTAGSPTISNVSGGGIALALDNANEVQNLCLSFGDILSYPISKLVSIEFWAFLTASLASQVSAFVGVGSARNDDPGAITTYAGFRAKGSNAIVCESDDNTTSIVDIATGQSLAATPVRLKIGFQEEVTPVSRGLSKGGLSAIQFFMTDAGGRLRRVATNQIFNMGAASGNVQPIIQIQKTSSTAVGTLTLKRARVMLNEDV